MASEGTFAALVKGGTEQSTTTVRQVPAPRPAPGEVLLRVEACGLCGSDVHAWRGDDGYQWVSTPVVLGHELVGTVAELGEGVDGDWQGRRVVPVGIVGCQDCATCAAGLTQICTEREVLGLSFDGGCAAYVAVPADRLVEVDTHAPALRMTLTEPMSVAGHAIGHLGQIPAGARVVVSGPGPIGLFAAWQLSQRGVDVLLTGVEQDEAIRLPAAARLGIRIARADQPGSDLTADYWVEASGSGRALEQAIDSVRPGGTVVVVALFAQRFQADVNKLVRKEVKLLGSYASVREDYVAAAAALAAAEGLEGVVSTAFPLSEALEALEATASGSVVKAVLVP